VNGMLIPAGTPAEIIKRLNAEFNKAISAPDMRSRMIANGYEPVGGAPERFGELIRTETEKWAKVVKAAGMKVD
jgi:tripartite-type tricarboxylate transporter receptor subunit TctC